MLTDRHLVELRASGLLDETIERAGFYSADAKAAAVVMGWGRAKWKGSYLVIPCPSVDGTASDGRYRVKPPSDGNGRPKYLQPSNVTPFACWTPSRSNDETIVILEGEKKSWAVWQCGYHAIGLTGIWNGLKSLPNKQRDLIDDLQRFNWCGRRTVILFDSDSVVKAGVRHSACELAAVLQNNYGAKPSILWLPTGPDDEHGIPAKMAADDFLAMFGPDRLRRLIDSAAAGAADVTADEYRESMRSNRRQSAGCVRVRIDRSGVGSGKTFQDVEFIAEQDQPSLVVAPSHSQCNEVLKLLQAKGLDAAKFPIMTAVDDPEHGIESTCENYPAAEEAMSMGLSASQAVCPKCPVRKGCRYRRELKIAEKVKHAVCTHSRAALVLEGMGEGKKIISIQENILSVLTPSISTATAFHDVIEVADQLYDETRSFGDGTITDTHWFAYRLRESAWKLQEALQSDYQGPIDLPIGIDQPPMIQRKLLGAAKRLMRSPAAANMRLAMAMTDGSLRDLAARTITSYQKRAGGAIEKQTRVITGVIRNTIPDGTTVWVGDASASIEQLRPLIDREIIDATPAGRIRQHKQILQITHDVKQSTSVPRMLSVLRTLICLVPHARRIGVITHQRFVPFISGEAEALPGQKVVTVLEPELRQRVRRLGWFWGVDSRGSNRWITECDCLLVLGTPRPSDPAVQQRLIETGFSHVLDHPSHWMGNWNNADEKSKSDYGWYWSGQTVSGRRRTVRSINYGDHRWRLAYESLAAAELTQSVGRARSILDSGIDCLVASSDEVAGATLFDEDPPLITADHWRWMKQMRSSGDVNDLLAPDTHAKPMSKRTAFRLLNWLISIGLAKRVAKGRYALSDTGIELADGPQDRPPSCHSW